MTVALQSYFANVSSTGEVTSSGAVATSQDAVVTGYATVATAIGVLVADAGSPTQAHVTTLNNAWTTLKALIDGNQTAAGHAATFTFDSTDIPSISKLTHIFNRLKDVARSQCFKE